MTEEIERRTILKGALGVGLAAAAVGGMGVLTSCSSDASSSSSAAPKGVPLPTFKANARVAPPDLPGDSTGIVPSGYYSYPTDLVASHPETPGLGGEVTAMFRQFSGLPPAVEKNQFWQELNERLNVDFKALIIPSEDYQAKLQTTLAGGELADLTMVYTTIPGLPDIAEARFEDLSPYLSGDNILDYPNLAAIATSSWQNSLVNNRLYGIARNSTIPNAMVGRADIAAAQGVDLSQVQTMDDFMAVCTALTDESRGQWALADPMGGTFNFFKEAYGVPNGWEITPEGEFIWEYETDVHKEALADLARYWKAGVINPDAFSGSLDIYGGFLNGKITLQVQQVDNVTGYYAIQANAADLPATFAPMLVPAYDGTKRLVRGGPGFDTVTMIKKTDDKDRVEELLQILDWLSAPFGTQENFFVNYGVEGVDHTMTPSGPVVTKTGTSELNLYTQFIGQANIVLVNPDRPQEELDSLYGFCQDVKPSVQFDPTLALYSATQSEKGASLLIPVTNIEAEIAQGRAPMSALDDAVATWRSSGGDEIRAQYEEAYAKSQDQQ